MSDDRIKRGLSAFVRSLFPRMPYLGHFPATVIKQNADGTLELRPDDSNLPGMSSVPIRLGIPGASVKVAAGARIDLFFEGGDPARPAAALFGSATVTQIIIASTDVEIGNGVMEPATKATSLASWLNGHTHPTPSGVSSAPSVPVSGIASASVKVGA